MLVELVQQIDRVQRRQGQTLSRSAPPSRHKLRQKPPVGQDMSVQVSIAAVAHEIFLVLKVGSAKIDGCVQDPDDFRAAGTGKNGPAQAVQDQLYGIVLHLQCLNRATAIFQACGYRPSVDDFLPVGAGGSQPSGIAFTVIHEATFITPNGPRQPYL